MPGLKGKPLIAYLLVCLFWGSTYLAIKIGVGELPPFLFAGIRFFVAGLILLAVALALGHRLPARAVDWRNLAIVGLFLFTGGNAFVVWAEQYIDSGLASLFVVTVALWTAFVDALWPGGAKILNWRIVLGLVLGFVGTALLVGASPAEILTSDLRGPLALTFASASWAFGSVFYKRNPTQTSPYISASIQMLAGGGVVALFGFVSGEASAWHFTARGMAAFWYLVAFGSLIGYSAYVYALHHASATIVGTYAYVNPVVAVALGALILNEPVTPRTFAAMGLILGAVLWIQFSHKLGRTDGMTDRRTDAAVAARNSLSDGPSVRRSVVS
jgi:drug/metabolite transporter (DMT)-like permease